MNWISRYEWGMWYVETLGGVGVDKYNYYPYDTPLDSMLGKYPYYPTVG